MRMLKPRSGGLISPEEAQRLLAAYEPPQDTKPTPAPSTPPDGGNRGKRKPRARSSLTDVLELHDIECVDVGGRVFEQYDQLFIRKDIFRERGKQKNFTSYQAAVHCEQKGLFLPSFALSCNIVAYLFSHKADADVERVLQQYKDSGNGLGWHVQNTIIDYGAEQVIHYPSAADFSQQAAVNATHSRTALAFFKSQLEDSLLEDALHDAQYVRFARQLTGLRDPSVLVEVGKHFGKPAKLWFPWNGQNGATYSEKRAAWLGCNYINFDIDTNNDLNNLDAARGVRRG